MIKRETYYKLFNPPEQRWKVRLDRGLGCRVEEPCTIDTSRHSTDNSDDADQQPLKVVLVANNIGDTLNGPIEQEQLCVCVYVYITGYTVIQKLYIYIYIYIYLPLSLSVCIDVNVCIEMYVFVCVCVCVCLCAAAQIC